MKKALLYLVFAVLCFVLLLAGAVALIVVQPSREYVLGYLGWGVLFIAGTVSYWVKSVRLIDEFLHIFEALQMKSNGQFIEMSDMKTSINNLWSKNSGQLNVDQVRKIIADEKLKSDGVDLTNEPKTIKLEGAPF